MTVLVITTLTNAVNIIDGLNGLSIGTCIIMAGAVGIIADMRMTYISASHDLYCKHAWLFVINFPLGRIFIGDGGAYLMGAIVAMLTILLKAESEFLRLPALLLCLSRAGTFYSAA